jgi:dipeptidyl aminopeptidase/acylaminoacyl peptidase
MRRAWVYATLCVTLWPAAGSAVPPLEAYGNLPSLDHLAISPDGKLLAFERTLAGTRTVLILSLDDHKVRGGLKSNNQKIRDLSWADNDHLLMTVSSTAPTRGVTAARQEWLLASSYSLSSGQEVPLLDFSDKTDALGMNIVDGTPTPRTVDGRTVLFVSGVTFSGGYGAPALFSVGPAGERQRIVDIGDSKTQNWLVDQDGSLIAKTDYDETTRGWTLFVRREHDWQKAFSVDAPIDMPQLEGLTTDGSSLLVAMPDGTDKTIRISDGAQETATGLGRYDRAIEDPVTHRIIGSERLDTSYHYRFLDRADQAAWNAIASAYGDESVQLVSWSADRKRIVVRLDGRNDGSSYELIDLNTHDTQPIGSVYTAIGPLDIAAVRQISYPAADGLTIPAYLTLPNGKPAKNLPLVVLAHGGPAARDTPQFDWWSQALAAQGYAVLQPQFRGSSGFGDDFLKAGFGQWGRKMQTDLSDGVRYLAGQGIVDPKRVCIVGASYGGYAALAGATLDKGVYRCAVSVSGISDIGGLLKWDRDREQRSDTQALRYWDRFMGAAAYDDPALKDISPISHAADVSIPILLIHGKDDTVVPLSQSRDMLSALNGAHKRASLVELDGEDHWLSRPETRLKMLTETVNFLIANNPPD